MKRSNMLGKIYNLLYQQTDIDESLAEDISIMVLDLVEKEGMSPPNVCGQYPEWDDKKYASHFHMGKDMDYWEKE